MAGGTCFGVLFAAVLCLCVVHSAEGQAKICDLAGGYDINTLRRCVKESTNQDECVRPVRDRLYQLPSSDLLLHENIVFITIILIGCTYCICPYRSQAQIEAIL